MTNEKNRNNEDLRKIIDGAKIPRSDMDKVTGSGAFEDVPKVEEHPYDEDVKNTI